MFRAHVVATTFLALATGLLSHPSASASAPAKPHPRHTPSVSTVAEPQLDIAISDGRISAARGDQLTYTIKVRNLGTTNAQALEISQTLPPGLRLVSSDHGGTVRDAQVSWVLNLKPGEESTVATVGEVGPTPDDLLRLASIACATTKDDPKPLVCATHSDLLPAAATHLARSTSHRIWYGAGAATAVLAGLVAFVLTRRGTAHRRSRLPT